MTFVQHFSKNENGRDFVIGDIHAHKTLFLRSLESVDFDKTKDRLFSLGDLVDRGDDNLSILKMFYENDWFHSIRGNHEQMLINRFEYPIAKPPYMSGVKTQQEAKIDHQINGGEWFDELTDSEQLIAYNALRCLPLAIELETDFGVIGLVHAEVSERYDSWEDFINELEESSKVRGDAIWSRLAIESVWNVERDCFWESEFLDAPRFIKGVIATIHGHKPVKEHVICGNQAWIDTAYLSGELTLIEVSKIIEIVTI